MKTITFILSLVSASLTVTAAAAVQNETDNVVNLPTYNVTAPRYTEPEKAIASSLAELRAQAQPANVVRTELPSFHVVAQKQPVAPARQERAFAAKPATQRPTRS